MCVTFAWNPFYLWQDWTAWAPTLSLDKVWLIAAPQLPPLVSIQCDMAIKLADRVSNSRSAKNKFKWNALLFKFKSKVLHFANAFQLGHAAPSHLSRASIIFFTISRQHELLHFIPGTKMGAAASESSERNCSLSPPVRSNKRLEFLGFLEMLEKRKNIPPEAHKQGRTSPTCTGVNDYRGR